MNMKKTNIDTRRGNYVYAAANLDLFNDKFSRCNMFTYFVQL